MPANPKEEYITIRVGELVKGQIQDLINDGRAEDISSFVRSAITEKLTNMSLTKAQKNEMFRERMREALQEDPSIIEDHIGRIGIRYFVEKRSDE